MLRCFETHVELTESAESTLREDLGWERLEAEISELRDRSWWRR